MVRGDSAECWAVTKWLLPLSLFGFASWHVILVHQETVSGAHFSPGAPCPPQVKCPLAEDEESEAQELSSAGAVAAPGTETGSEAEASKAPAENEPKTFFQTLGNSPPRRV